MEPELYTVKAAAGMKEVWYEFCFKRLSC